MCNVNCTVHEIIKETWVTNSRYCGFDGFMKNVCWFKYTLSVKQVSLFKPIGILSTSEHNLTLLLHKEMYTTLVQTLSLLSHVLCPSNFSIFSFRSLSLSMVYYSFLCSTSSIFWLRHSFIYTFDFFTFFLHWLNIVLNIIDDANKNCNFYVSPGDLLPRFPKIALIFPWKTNQIKIRKTSFI